MGRRYTIKCSNCNYNKCLTLGIGMLYSTKNVFYKSDFNNSKPMLETLVRSKRIKENVLKLIDSGGIPSENYKHNVYCCTNCNEIYSRFYFCIISEGKVYEPEYHCSKCKRILNKVRIISEKDNLKIFDEHKEYSWKCPICGCNKLEIDNDSGILMWD
ncbi:hypothetical protein CLL_A2077 [Clostridium botulinum B str. Eklund 17B (NRP)]|uniref:Uncharacterized protein n=1 Tax=Clostridium botulinum (strain Eklund 17B / Type B) TaxID=935198 RepID=B2TLI0_CLOBB|nr:hypothetical protein CLL_A2077 [Clostridium botulinum B str. Eklund 17B (NRP)]MCR1272787.1 hypothetical protein [Clostridium botulinum]CDH90982.1 conserved hypothetical protein [Clostridium botulinum B str. Eklund 17B (NRP)]